MGSEALNLIGKIVDINMIQSILPHRYPFLLVDKLIEVTEQRIVGIKNVTINEPFFQGHFPGHPIMPGVLILEAMAQVGGVGTLSLKNNTGKLAYFMAIDNARFRRPVMPGDVLRIEVDLLKSRMGVIQVHAVAKVEDKVVTEADMMFALVDPNKGAK